MGSSRQDIAAIDGKPTANYRDLQTPLRRPAAASVAVMLRQRNTNELAFTEHNVDQPTFALQIVNDGTSAGSSSRAAAPRSRTATRASR